ncbi:DUF724 domain-containing protein 2-like isoform X3 [Juglans microcarpa x Juglans regia]|uniref:DUF724 domain-containing protein 2-like isoform X3 n=1 Tax=Juglans microcarpa x Juglans regia TaxID=2249226 RepID=UPI001B7EB78F|nr:DUF724 domain-containing protein 2-like isoform X3 [Juglans microcarpa x Juglans regia]
MGSFESSSETNHLYSLGVEVEVTRDEPGFKVSWYLATIIDLPSVPLPKMLQRARVEYQTLLTEDGSEPLKEYVDLAYIRPSPPQQEVAAQNFEHGDVVGAYFRDGWWTGVVVRVLGDSSYRVFFENPPGIFEFDRKYLRVHLEWLGEKWVRTEKQDRFSFQLRDGSRSEYQKENLSDAWFPATVIKENGDDTFLVKYESSDESNLGRVAVDFLHIRASLPPPPQANIKYDVLEKVDAFCDFAWRPGLIAKRINDTRYLVYFNRTNEDKIINLSNIRPRVEWKDGKWVSRYQTRHDQIASNPEGTVEVEGSGVTRDSMSERTLLSANSVKKSMEQSSLGDGKGLSYALTGSMKKMKLPTSDGNSTESHPPKKLRRRNTLEALLSATACNLRKRQSKTSTKVLSGLATPNSEDKQSRHSEADANQRFAEIESLGGVAKVWTGQRKHGQLDSQETNTMRSKEGRSTKSQVKSPLSSAADAGKEDNADGGTAKEIVHEDKICPHISGGNSIKRKRGRPRKVVVTISKGKEQNGDGGAVDGTVVEVLPTQGVASYMLTVGKSTDSQDVSTANNVGMTSLAASGNMDDDDDQPLSTWIDGMLHCPTIIKESKLSPVRTVNECNEVREQKVGIAQQVPAADATSDCVLDETRSLPFVKNSPIWKTIEGMEIFRLMPQDAHFRPLGKCKEEYREGLAVANMVTFTSLVEKISKLRLDDPRSIFYGYLESLHELEKHGFDVTVLQGRMNELLSIKDREGQILNESKDAEFKILHYNQEKTVLAEEMANITTQITKLQVEHTLIESKMKSKELEISRLQKRVDTINEDIQGAQLDFEKTAAASWKLE